MLLSIPKILWLIAILWGVWTIFKVIEKRRLKDSQQDPSHQSSKHARQRARQKKHHEDQDENSVELIECTLCGAYVAKTGCKKSDCPVRG